MNRPRLTILLLIIGALGCGRQSPPPKSVAPSPDVKAKATATSENLLAKADATQDPVTKAAVSASPEPLAEPIAPAGRIILFTPVGPLVLELAVSIDGEALAVARQRVVDEMVARLTSEAKGELSWETALADPRFSLGENPRTRQDRRILIASVDANRDQLVQPDEAAEYLARLANVGPALGFGVSEQTWSDRAASPLWRLADADGDGALALDEIGAIEEELRDYDADGNELIDAAELARDDMPMRPGQAMPYGRSSTANSKLAILCDATFRGDSLAYTIDELYPQATADAGPPAGLFTVPKLIEALDANFNGRIDGREPLSFTEIEPHGRIEVAFGGGKPAQGAVDVKWRDAELATAVVQTARPDRMDCELRGDRLMIARRELPGGPDGMQNQLSAQFASLDKDSNGYLEKGELPEGNMNLSRALRAADADNDGKLYRAELEAFVAWQSALRSAGVRLDISSAADPLFGLLDASGDGRLTQRELRAAVVACKSRDRNGDERLDLAELPVSIRLDFGRVAYAAPKAPADAAENANSEGSTTANVTSAETGPPGWFVKMDTNGDGDLVSREFLGTREQFKMLDTNADGFIDAAEAKAAK